MKATGMIRRVDDLGRLVIPKEIRRTLGIAEGDPLEIFVDFDKIIFKRYAPGCSFCSNADVKMVEIIEGKPVCEECIQKLVAKSRGST